MALSRPFYQTSSNTFYASLLQAIRGVTNSFPLQVNHGVTNPSLLQVIHGVTNSSLLQVIRSVAKAYVACAAIVGRSLHLQ